MLQSPSTAVFHPHFSPWLADSEQLARTLVGHHDIVRDFLGRLAAVERGGAANHVLLVGPRGIGKTHVLCLIERYVSGRLQIPQDWTGPSKAWVSAFFTEEEYAGQDSLANFLLNLLAKLREALPPEQLWSLPENLHREADHAVIDCCFERLERFHTERNKRVLLVVDNLKKVFQQWPEDERARLRSFLSRNNFLLILGSAPSVFGEVMDQRAAFHDFFEVRILSELSNEQMLDLLSRRFAEDGRQAEFETRREELSKKIPAIEVLTGGNPRLVLFLYQIATRSAFLDIEVALRNLLEEVREYFVRRFDELPDQARKVLDTIAQMPGPATPTEIAEAARLRVAIVNAQLKRLKEGHYVQPIKLQRRKATRYDITERLFRIWRQTATVAGRQRFRFLADFLKLYFTPEEIRALYSHHDQYLRTALNAPRDEIIRHVGELYYFQAASEGDIRYGAFSSRVESLMKIGEWRWAEEEAQCFAAESLKQHDKLGATAAYKAQAGVHLHAGRCPEALEDINKLIELGAPEDAASVAEQFLKANPDSAEGQIYFGACLVNLGDSARALDAFRKAAEVGKPTAPLRNLEAAALCNLGRWEEALRCAEEAVVLDPAQASGWQLLGLSANNLGHYERALEAFRKAVQMEEPTAELWTNQAIALNHLERWEEALHCAERAVALDINGASAWEQLGAAAFHLGRYQQALEAVRKVAGLRGPSAGLWTNQAIALNNLARWQEALQCAEQAVALDPSFAAGWEHLGIAAGNLSHHERALEACRKAGEVGQPTADLWTNQAIALNKLERWDEALQCAGRAVALDASFGGGWEQLGVAAYNMGRYERALGAFGKAAEVGQPTAALWTNQAIMLNKLRRWEEARQCAEQAVALDPNCADAWEQLGAAVGSLGQDQRALEALRKAAEVGQPTADLWTCQAIALNKLRRWEEALHCAEQAVALDANNAEAWRQLGAAVGNLGQDQRALEAFRKAAEVGQPTADLWTNQAIALSKLRRWEEALHCAEQAVTLNASRGRGWEELGVAVANLGNHERALEAFRKAAEVDKPTARILTLQAAALRCLGRYQEGLNVLEAVLASEPDSSTAWIEKGWTLAALDSFEEALKCAERAREHGSSARDYHHARGDLLLLAGRFQDGLYDLDSGLRVEPNDWDMQTDRLIALGCLGRQGPLMEALPAALAQVHIPPESVSTVLDFMYEVALNSLRRGDTHTSRGLFAATLEMKCWHASEWFGKQSGNFLRRLLDIKPEMFQSFVSLFAQKVGSEDVLKLLDPFVKASQFLQTRDLSVLERVFPEVRELVLDIIRRVDPQLHEETKRLT
jgi:tetratricopeptide (TPR) repeat protein